MKILTIDFDIIMAPSIEIYNSLAGGNSPIGEVLEQDIPLLRYADADLTAYQTLTNFLIAAANDMHPSNFHFIMNHADVIKCLPENESIDLMNIEELKY